MALLAAPSHADILRPEKIQQAKRLLQLGAEKAKEVYERVQRKSQAHVATRLGQQPDCQKAAFALKERWPEFLLAARLSRDIYTRHLFEPGWAERLTDKDERREIVADGKKITLWFDHVSKGYAEVHHDALDGAQLLVFRGTRLRNLKDMSTNLRQFANIVPERYQWAAWLAARVSEEAPGKRLFITGHSLGGGLAAYAALTQDAQAAIFNPAGLSQGALETLPASALKTGERNIVAFIARSGKTLDAVSSLSLAGEGTIAGRRYLIERESGLNPLQIHNMAGLFQELAENPETPFHCEADLGVQRLDDAPASL